MVNKETEEGPLKCRRYWLWISFIVLFASAIVLLVVLRFGNPQWNRWIYIFQANLHPGHKSGIVPIPKDYTGKWSHWTKNGLLFSTMVLQDGMRHGPFTAWHENGSLYVQVDYFEKKAHGKATFYWPNGIVDHYLWYRHGIEHGPNLAWTADGRLEYVRFFVNGRRVAREKYVADRAKDPTLPEPPDEDIEKE